MKWFIVALGFVASVLAQSVDILAPTENQVLVPGQNFTVQVLTPVSPHSDTCILDHD